MCVHSLLNLSKHFSRALLAQYHIICQCLRTWTVANEVCLICREIRGLADRPFGNEPLQPPTHPGPWWVAAPTRSIFTFWGKFTKLGIVEEEHYSFCTCLFSLLISLRSDFVFVVSLIFTLVRVSSLFISSLSPCYPFSTFLFILSLPMPFHVYFVTPAVILPISPLIFIWFRMWYRCSQLHMC